MSKGLFAPLFLFEYIHQLFSVRTQYYSPSKPNQFLSGVVLFILDVSVIFFNCLLLQDIKIMEIDISSRRPKVDRRDKRTWRTSP